MALICVTKEFTLDIAHALEGYDGKCQYIHGHTYSLEVTVVGQVETSLQSPKVGMVMDFSDLKKVVNEEIIHPFDHSLVLWERDHRKDALVSEQRVIMTPYQPTCENLLLDFVTRLKRSLSDFPKLHTVKLRETPTSYATWKSWLNED